MNKKIKWGIVGTGTIAHQFAADFTFAEYGELNAVASRNLESAKSFSQLYNIPKAYSSYTEMFKDPEIDVVYIATPHNFHFENSKEALSYGKAVLCEKPITVTPHQSKELFDYAKSKDGFIIEGMWTYFLPAIQKAKEWVDQGRIGQITQIKSDFGYPVPFDPEGRMFNPDLAGGALLDMGVYNIAMAWLFMPVKPKEITVLGRKASTGVDHDVSMLLEYDDACAQLHTSFRSKLPNFTYVIGTDGYIEIFDFWRAKECKLYKVEECIDHFKDDRQGSGFEHEIDGVSKQLIEKLHYPKVVTHETSQAFQELMADIRDKI